MLKSKTKKINLKKIMKKKLHIKTTKKATK